MDRKDLVRYTCRDEKSEQVPLVLTYSNLLPDVSCIVRKHLRTLHKKVQVGKDQEKAQSEKDSHSKNRGWKKLN